jgi:membrane-bound lytic murein transglycosylase A
MRPKIKFFFPAIAPLIAVLILLTSGCAPTRDKVMQRISAWSYPKFSDDMRFDALEYSISQSLTYLYKIPVDRQFVFGNDRYTTQHMIRSLEYFLDYIQTRPSTGDLDEFIRSNYIVYRSVGRDGDGEVLYTGYYEPHLRGSLTSSDEYRFPLYARPPDLLTVDLSLFNEKYAGQKIIGRLAGQTVVPYYDRNEIDAEGVLDGKADVLVWVDDPIDVFFLQIQGSGKVYLDSGEVLNIHYQTSNGRPYRSIGTLLIQEEQISVEEMSMQKIREYLNNHPDKITAVFNYNPSYVFFKIEPNGPLGNINVKLTPGRSIALDRRIFPAAALVFIETEKPVVDGSGQIESWQPFSRFALNQDTGGAIQGPGRADLFFGNGPYAEIAAGHLKHTGKLYFLVLKSES